MYESTLVPSRYYVGGAFVRLLSALCADHRLSLSLSVNSRLADLTWK